MPERAPSRELARFVPASVLERVMSDGQPLADATHTRFPAAVLFADISGFTRLSERLAEKGARGVEDLTRILNTYFGRLIEIIHAHGGDVAKFAGDALLAVWRASDESALPGRAHAAAHCALAARDALRGFELDAGGTLALRLGIGAGEADAATIGGVFGRWEYVVYGPALIEATHAAAEAEPDQTMAGHHAWEFLRGHFDGTSAGAGGTRVNGAREPDVFEPLALPEPSDDIAGVLLSYIPAAIHLRLAARQSAWLGELRRITVLFVNLPDVRADTPVETMQRAMRSLQDGLYRFEGSVNKLSIDEKGVTLVAALGLPPLAHEDDAIRGLRAALELRSRLDALGWSGSIGITSGRVFCGTIGSARRCEYTIIGDVVNLSARLMQAAHGGILCDAATHEAAVNRIEFETLEPVTVKGKARAIPIFRPLGEAGPHARFAGETPMIGRVAEQHLVQNRLDLLAAGREGGVVVIEGEAGIGKSRFVAGIAQSAGRLGLRAIIAGADAIERSTSYFAWRGVFREMLAITHPAQVAAAVESVLAFDPDLVRLAPLLGIVLGEKMADNETTAHMTQEARITSTHDLLVRLLARTAEQRPMPLIIEDCHWLDSSSWALARRVSKGIGPVLLVLVTRPLADPVPREYAQFIAAPATTRIILEPLSGEESLALVCERLGVRSIPAAVAEPIRAKAQGHPFYTEELAFALRDSGIIIIADGECRVAPGRDLSTQRFPDTVQGVVISRIDRLSPPVQLTLKVASVIGRTFSCRVLQDVFPMDGETQNSAFALEALVSSNLTLPDAPDPDPTQIFRHAITQEVAYNLMPPTQRSALHRSIAEWYEATHRDNLTTYYPLLAKHWSSADDLPKAIEYLEKSADDALRQFANEEVIRFLDQALLLAERAPDQADDFRRARWHRQLGDAYYNLDNLAGSREQFRAALRLLGHPMPGGTTAYIGASLWEFAKQIWHRLRRAGARGESGIEAKRALEAARAYERLAQIWYLNNEKPPTIHAAFKALNLAEQAGPCPELARCYANTAVVSGLLMMHGSARAHARRARETAELVNQPPCTAYVDFIRSVYWVTVGAWDDAERDAGNATRIAQQIGERRRWVESAFTLQNTLIRRGDFQRSIPMSTDLAETSRRNGSLQGLVWGLSWQIWAEGIASQAPPDKLLRAELAECLEREAEVPLADQILGHAILAWSAWCDGSPLEAMESAGRARAVILRTSQVAHYLQTPFNALAEVYYAHATSRPAGDPARLESIGALAQLSSLLSQFRLMYPFGVVTHSYHRGRLLFLRGKSGAARRVWRRGIRAAKKYAQPYDEGLLHRELARHSPAGDRTLATHLAEARRLFAQVGAREALGTMEAT